MIGIIVAGHGNLGKELVSTAKMIIGSLEKVEVAAIYAKEGVKDLEKKLKEAIDKINNSEGILILIDIFGGSPAAASLSFVDKYKIKVVTGVNLPILLEVVTHRESSNLDELANMALAAGKKSILKADEIFRRNMEKIK